MVDVATEVVFPSNRQFLCGMGERERLVEPPDERMEPRGLVGVDFRRASPRCSLAASAVASVTVSIPARIRIRLARSSYVARVARISIKDSRSSKLSRNEFSPVLHLWSAVGLRVAIPPPLRALIACLRTNRAELSGLGVRAARFASLNRSRKLKALKARLSRKTTSASAVESGQP